jgi:hypothetical protein
MNIKGRFALIAMGLLLIIGGIISPGLALYYLGTCGKALNENIRERERNINR